MIQQDWIPHNVILYSKPCLPRETKIDNVVIHLMPRGNRADGLSVYDDRRSEMFPSCSSLSKELVEKVALSVLERQNTYFKRHIPTSDFSEG